MDYKDIPRFPHSGYEVDIGYNYLERWLKAQVEEEGLDLDPDFQRGHVWTTEQRIRFVEYQLRGGEGGKVLSFNRYGWSGYYQGQGPYQILDGKQRLTSALMFLRDELPVFGALRSQIKGHLRNVGFKWRIFELETRAQVLGYYLDMNAGGTPHAEAEIARVRQLLIQELVTP